MTLLRRMPLENIVGKDEHTIQPDLDHFTKCFQSHPSGHIPLFETQSICSLQMFFNFDPSKISLLFGTNRFKTWKEV